ncbi:MAG: nucleotide exchange factor GrpE [Verrucomicrobiota bacterium]
MEQTMSKDEETAQTPLPESEASASNFNQDKPSPKYELVDGGAWKEAQNALAEIASLKDRIARSQAEFENSRKRLQREKEDAVRYANLSLLETLLPVIDNFELGLQAADTATDSKSIAMGMKMVKTQLDKFLEECGVESIDAMGQSFDPSLHDAVSQKASSEHEEGTVIEQSRKGYKLRDRLIRPASVVVAEAPKS